MARMDRQGLASAEAMGRVIAQDPQIEAIVCGHLHRPIHTRWQGTVVTTAPSPAHQVALDLDNGDRLGWVMEPPACLLHWWREGAGLVTHTRYVGEFAGPYPAYQSGMLIVYRLHGPRSTVTTTPHSELVRRRPRA